MSFLSNLINEFTNKDESPNPGPSGYYPQEQQYSQQQTYDAARPQVAPPWVAEWDDREDRWMYLNRETGERTHEHPGQRGYGGGGYGGEYNQEHPGQGQQDNYYQQEPPAESHTGRNAAVAGGLGLAGGAFAMHEGEKAGR
jgi:hypothetical protein